MSTRYRAVRWLFAAVAVSAVLILTAAVTPQVSAAAGRQFNNASRQYGDFSRHGIRGEQHTQLAEALGISVEALQAAQEEARNAAIDQAVEDGRISEEEAEQLRQQDPGRLGHGDAIAGKNGMDLLLANALDISVDELASARERVFTEMLNEAVAEGRLSQEQADLMQAQRALHDYVTPLLQNAYEEGVRAAVAAGIITQAQADQLLTNEGGRLFGGGRGHHGFHAPGDEGFHSPRGRGLPGSSFREPGEATPESNSSTTLPTLRF
jgi:polyhydroxyalkanoate synthesis regulator phasin